MDYWLIVFVLTGPLLGVTSAQTRQYHFVSTQLNWTEAQSLCRRHYTDLATVENAADVDAVINLTSNFTGKAWLGLHDDLENSWRWSLNDSGFYGEEEATFRNWYPGQPNNLNAQEYCVELLSGRPYFGTWNDTDCSVEKPFVCYNGTMNGMVSFVVSDTSLNWTDAQRHCRENYVDLASIRNQTENTIITNQGNSSSLWIGLYRQRQWSDGSQYVFQHWADGKPSSGADQCVAASFSDSGRWSDENCSLAFPPICYMIVPQNPENLRPSTQNETSITLQWNKVNNNISFALQFNGSETNISAPVEDGPVTHTVSSLSAGTKYTFTLFSVFENVRSSGEQLTAVTAPPNVDVFRSTGQDEDSIALQWNPINNDISFVLEVNGLEIVIAAPNGDAPVTHTVSSLTPATNYTFTLFSVFENVRSSGVQLTTATGPSCAQVVCPSGRDCISIDGTTQCVDPCDHYTVLNDDWRSINNSYGAFHSDWDINWKGWYRLFLGQTNAQIPDRCVEQYRCGTYAPLWITEPHPTQSNEIVNRYVCTTWGGSCCQFFSHTIQVKLCYGYYYVYKLVAPGGFYSAYCAAPRKFFRASTQNETSITLQWNKVNNNISFVLQFNGSETNISAPDGDGPVTHTVSSLSAGTKYTFTLFSVFENVTSRGEQLTAVTAPPNVDVFRSTGKDEDSIALQWNPINNDISFVLEVNGLEIVIAAPNGDAPVTHTVSSLTPATNYTFTLFSVFENVRSSGVQLTTATGLSCAQVVCPSGRDCISINGTTQCVDPCDHYTVLNDDWRSINNSYGAFHCDWDINWKGWYRLFLGQTNAQIPDRCVEQYRCGTYAPLWITEPHPTQSNEIVNRYVCTTWGGSCCQFFSHTIQVKLCYGYYYVYKLVAPWRCYSAYCAAPRKYFRASTQNETSITLQWDKVNNSISFVLQFNGSETNISAPDGDGPVTHTVSSLSAGTKYTFTLFSVFENFTSRGEQLTAVTAPPNVDVFRSTGQDEDSIALQWNPINNDISFVLEVNGLEIVIAAPNGDAPVTHTVSSLTPATNYTFTLFSVFENVRSSGVQLTTATGPSCAQVVCPSGRDCISINGTTQCVDPCDHYTVLNDDWRSINNSYGAFHFDWDINWKGWYRLFLGQTNAQIPDRCIEQYRCGTYTPLWITEPHPTQSNEIVNRYVCTTWGGSCCQFFSHTIQVKLCYGYYYVYKLVAPGGFYSAYCAAPRKFFRASTQNETSITLQWDKVNNSISFVLQFNGSETDISAPVGDEPITHTVSSLSAGTKYTFTLFSVFENFTSRGEQLTAVTVPPNAKGFRASTQTETSITLQWNKVNNNISFVLQFNGSETNISAPVGDGPVTHTVSSLSAGTKYTFTLFSVFENIRSSGVSITAATGYVIGLDLGLKSLTELSESETEDLLAELLRQYGFSMPLSVKVRFVKP